VTDKLLIAGIRCLKCGDVIYSRAGHDFRRCSCTAVAIDGGFSYTRIVGNREDFEGAYFLLPVSKAELYEDWNSGTDKFGKISKGDQVDIDFFTLKKSLEMHKEAEVQHDEKKAEVRAVNKELFKVKIEHEVTPQQICNLLVTAFDGYFTKQWLACEEVHMPRVPDWSWCSEEEREEWEAVRKIYVAAMCGGTVSFIDRVENDDPDESPNLLIMDKHSLIRGLKIMAEKYPRHFQDFIREKDDAITGDIYVQCCLLDEAPYG